MSKTEFLELLFENFRQCLTFANRAKTVDFKVLIDPDSKPGTSPSPKRNNDLPPLINQSMQRAATEGDDRLTPPVHVPISRMSNLPYQNYNSGRKFFISRKKVNLSLNTSGEQKEPQRSFFNS